MESEYIFSEEDLYEQLEVYMKGLTEGENDIIANLSNASALLSMALQDINWVGFYIAQNDQLVLGPFQGKPACIRITKGRGVCGTAFLKDQIQLVNNVHEFPGHIACDGASNSEIVLPIHKEDKTIFGVLDIDSPIIGRFSDKDRDGLEKTVKIIEKFICR